MMRTALCAIVLMVPAFAFGQQKFNASSFIELLRSDIRTKKVALVSQAMQFTDEEAAAFWPIYKNNQINMLLDLQLASRVPLVK